MEVHYGVLDGVEVAEPRLTDGVVTLRLAQAGDRAAVAAMDEDAEIRRWVEYRLTPWEEAGNEIAYLQMMWSLRQGVLFTILVDDELAGLIEVEFRHPRTARVHYRVRRELRRRRLATRALRLVSDWVIDELGLNRVEVWAHGGNVASQGVADRAGLRREGVLRQATGFDGSEAHDKVYFGRLANDPRPPPLKP